MPSVLVVGTVAFDSIETSHGVADDVLGGSATFFSYSASFFTRPRLVGVVGEDFPASFRSILAEREIDTGGLVTETGKISWSIDGLGTQRQVVRSGRR